jgi:hypothetical protein
MALDFPVTVLTEIGTWPALTQEEMQHEFDRYYPDGIENTTKKAIEDMVKDNSDDEIDDKIEDHEYELSQELSETSDDDEDPWKSLAEDPWKDHLVPVPEELKEMGKTIDEKRDNNVNEHDVLPTL